ncbi:UNVERIFIED_CONTAM: hypothetical protein GTU68_016265 [Idotea baltica]|nr:hypothetical protein [Idotea baltica]
MNLPANWPSDSDWTAPLESHFASQDFQQLLAFVGEQRAEHAVYPPAADTFNAFHFSPLAETKVVILGQDPYHGPGQAHGLSFSVLPGIKIPPSLRNIYKELSSDTGCETPADGDLSAWAQQGVLLLNTVLTVRDSEANSHRKHGWENFTDAVINVLSDREQPVVFILWGKPAEKKVRLIDDRHSIIIAPHPSPLSAHRGFFGSRPFSQANAILAGLGQSPIDWTLS